MRKGDRTNRSAPSTRSETHGNRHHFDVGKLKNHHQRENSETEKILISRPREHLQNLVEEPWENRIGLSPPEIIGQQRKKSVQQCGAVLRFVSPQRGAVPASSSRCGFWSSFRRHNCRTRAEKRFQQGSTWGLRRGGRAEKDKNSRVSW